MLRGGAAREVLPLRVDELHALPLSEGIDEDDGDAVAGHQHGLCGAVPLARGGVSWHLHAGGNASPDLLRPVQVRRDVAAGRALIDDLLHHESVALHGGDRPGVQRAALRQFAEEFSHPAADAGDVLLHPGPGPGGFRESGVPRRRLAVQVTHDVLVVGQRLAEPEGLVAVLGRARQQGGA